MYSYFLKQAFFFYIFHISLNFKFIIDALLHMDFLVNHKKQKALVSVLTVL